MILFEQQTDDYHGNPLKFNLTKMITESTEQYFVVVIVILSERQIAKYDGIPVFTYILCYPNLADNLAQKR